MKKFFMRAVCFLLALNMAFSGAISAIALELKEIGEKMELFEEETKEPEEELSLESIAWENLTYGDIFIENNLAYLDGFNGKTFSPFVQNAGTNTVTNEAFYTAPYSLKAFGSPSQQIKSPETISESGDYFVASKVYCTRYVKGELGVCLYSITTGITEVNSGFETASGIVSAEKGSGIFIGSIHSADLDGYVDDPAVINMAIFENPPSVDEMTALYENYVEIEKSVEREEIEYTDEEMLSAFVDYMNEKAAEIGMENSVFKDPIGMDNKTTAKDLLNLLVYADSTGKLDDVWGKSSHTVSVTGEKSREQTVKSIVIKPALEDYYHILGGKGGTLSAYNARNLAVILEIPESEDKLAVVALYANGTDTSSESRFEAARQIADAALLKYENPDYDNSGTDVCCKSAIACVIPGEGADLNNLRMLYSKDENAERVPASITKVLTAVCAFDYVSDFEAEFAYKDFDTQIGSFYTKDFFPGDGITFKDALYAMLLPSSNVTARMVARTVGGIILAEGEEPDEGYTGEVLWEQGTITAATGIEKDYPNVVRNKGYLELSDYSGITLNSGHYLTYFVYDKDYNYLGNGKADLTANFLLSGEGISTKEMLIRYPEGVYFRVALWRGKDGEMTVDMIPDSGVRFYDAEYGPVIWEMGSIYAKSGITFVREQVIRCISYLPIENYVGVGIGKGYAVGYLAYDENLNYLGNGNPDKTGYFVTNGFYTEDIIENYPETKYMKLIFREDPIADFTMDAVEKSGVRVYKKGEEFELPEPELKATNIMTMNSCQDGAVYNKKVFLFNNSGNCNVFDIETKAKIGSFTVDEVSVLNPHANSVCFGNEFYKEGDKYPLLYVNIYNNYWEGYADKKEGTCCVYRITEENGVFGSELVQVIKIGFTDDYDLWNSAEDNGYEYYLPYGNFVVDTDKDKLWAFVLRNGEEQTRFFKFDLPEIGDGVYSETYGCNLVTLESTDIIEMFDTEHLVVIQGCCYYGGKILSVTGLGKGTVASPYIQVIDPEKGEIEKNICFEEIGITNEPEMISVDPIDGTIYYASVDGILRKLEINTDFTVLKPETKQLVEGFEAVSSIEPGDSCLSDAFNTVSPLVFENLKLFENNAITALNLFVTGTVVDNDGTNKNDPEIDDNAEYTFDISVIDSSSVKAGGKYSVKKTYTLTVKGSEIRKNDWNTFDISDLGIVVEEGETLGFGSGTSTLEIYYINKNISSKLCYFGHNNTTGDTTLRLRTTSNLPIGVEGYSTKEPEIEDPKALKGKTLSILGASISTYAGVSNGAAADTTNSTILNNAKYYPNNTVKDVALGDTWWMQFADDLGLRLLVNNSWSGGAILLERAGTVGAYVDRCVQLHDDTGENAGEDPDIIIIQKGFNDFSYGKSTLGTAEDIDYDELILEDGYAEPKTTMEATVIMLDKMTKRYPDAEIYMFSHFKRVKQSAADTELMEKLNASIETVCERYGIKVIDLYSVLGSVEFVGDGSLHPNRLGMDIMTEAAKRTVLANTAYEVETHLVSFELDGVSADYGDDKIILDGKSFSVNLSHDGDAIEISVTMGGKEIAETVYKDGKVSIESVTGDVVIKAKSVHEPKNYRWEFDGANLVCISGENALTKISGTATDGIFNKTAYSLEESIVLMHDKPWTVEWKSEGTFMNENGSTGARIFTSDNINANYNARYIFKSATKWLIAMGEKDTKGSHNYGIALEDYGIDGSALHTYRLENRIAENGSNMVYLFVDGKEIGALNNYYVGTTDKKTTSDWLSGKDFGFPYMGTDTHGFSNAKIDYIAVWENGEKTESLSLRYDDRYDVSGKTVEIVDAGKPTSYKVGYGVEEGTLDDTVVTLAEDKIIATGIGTAKVRIDGVLYEITVEAAPISLLLLIGQSNMRGSEGNANQSIICPEGVVYATYGDDRGADNTAMSKTNARFFAPSALAGEYSSINVEGTTECLSGYPIYSLNETGAGKIGPDSGFGYEWAKQTGEKVWIVNAAHGGTSINAWQDGGKEFEECEALFKACQETLQKEIAAGHFTLSHMAYFWCQGCSDAANTAEQYAKKYLSMHESLKNVLAFDHDSDSATADYTFEFGGIIPVRAGNATSVCYREGVYTDTTTAKYHESFKDLRFTGPRVAQYWMINNPELTDIWGVCNIGEDWVWMPDGTNGVADYFNAHYENGTVDYQTQVAQKESWYTPTTPAAVHDSIHYNQIGYNEVGRESVRNALIMLGEIEMPEVETTVELLSWNGYTEVSEVPASTSGNSGTLVVPKVYPIWEAKNVEFKLSEGLQYVYYDLIADSAEREGTFSVNGKTVSVIKAEPGAHYKEHLSELPEKVCSGLNLWNVLEHDEYYFASGTNWAIYSDKTVKSVTIPVEAGDKIFATSFGKSGENGHASTSGIRTTFFSAYGVAKTMTPAECYAEFSKNGGYLIAPESATAINVAMWSDSSENELYILSAKHDTDSGICGICGKDSHTHEWSEWAMKEIPGKGEPVTEERTCSGCGETETREVESVWQKYNLAEHYSDLPEKVCSGLNLWNVLPHDEYYFANGTNWGKHSSGNVYSVTIPVEAGERIFATAWGKAVENGHATANGIRVSFFSAYGVAKTMTPAECYAEFSKNGGYLIAPENAIAVNIAMWNNSDENEIYLLDREHSYENGICTICRVLEYPMGDLNLDGVVDVMDAYTARLIAAKLVVPTEQQLMLGDVDGDGKITAVDANYIRKYSARIIESFPVET